MSHFTKISTQFQDLDVLSQTLERLGLSAERDTEATDYYGKLIGVKPLVVKKPKDWSADFYFDQTKSSGYVPNIDHMDQRRYDSLNLSQEYAKTMIERFAAQHGMFVDSTILRNGTIEYQLVTM